MIKARLRGAKRAKPFRYRSYGNLATIGRKAAVIDFGWIHLRGLVAWVIWSVVQRKPDQSEYDRSRRARRHQEEALDDALKNTFPASDPISIEQPAPPDPDRAKT